MTEYTKKQPRTRTYQLDIGQVAKSVEKAFNRLTRGTDERGVSQNQNIPIP